MAARTDTGAIPKMDVVADVTNGAPALLTEREFHTLYGQTATSLRRYVIRTLGSSTHADDVVQETYLRVLRRPVPARSDDELRAYVFRIASHLVVDYWREHKRESTDPVPERGAPGPDQALRVDMSRLFARLKPRERQLVWLAHVEGAGHREIAALLGLRTASIRVLLARARNRLARLLRENGHVPEGER